MSAESTSRSEPVEALVELAKKKEELEAERREVEPDTVEECSLDGELRGLRMALDAFSDVDEWSHKPEWNIAIEDNEGNWEWYYPYALTREKAIKKARDEAKEDLGEKPLNVYEVGGPIAR